MPVSGSWCSCVNPALRAVGGCCINATLVAVVPPGFPVVGEIGLVPGQALLLGVALFDEDVNVRVAGIVVAHKDVVVGWKLVGAKGTGRLQYGVRIRMGRCG